MHLEGCAKKNRQELYEIYCWNVLFPLQIKIQVWKLATCIFIARVLAVVARGLQGLHLDRYLILFAINSNYSGDYMGLHFLTTNCQGKVLAGLSCAGIAPGWCSMPAY